MTAHELARKLLDEPDVVMGFAEKTEHGWWYRPAIDLVRCEVDTLEEREGRTVFVVRRGLALQ